MEYKISNTKKLKKNLGFALNKYILKHDIDISTLACTSHIPKGTIIKICLGKNYHWNDFFKVLNALNLKTRIDIGSNNT